MIILYEHTKKHRNRYIGCWEDKSKAFQFLKDCGFLKDLSRCGSKIFKIEFDMPYNVKTIIQDVIWPIIDANLERD
jgi:hypothetical protein